MLRHCLLLTDAPGRGVTPVDEKGNTVSNRGWGPFIVGVTVGGVAGAVAGTLLSQHVVHLLSAFVGVVDRRLTEAEREKIRFELLLQ